MDDHNARSVHERLLCVAARQSPSAIDVVVATDRIQDGETRFDEVWLDAGDGPSLVKCPPSLFDSEPSPAAIVHSVHGVTSQPARALVTCTDGIDERLVLLDPSAPAQTIAAADDGEEILPALVQIAGRVDITWRRTFPDDTFALERRVVFPESVGATVELRARGPGASNAFDRRLFAATDGSEAAFASRDDRNVDIVLPLRDPPFFAEAFLPSAATNGFAFTGEHLIYANDVVLFARCADR